MISALAGSALVVSIAGGITYWRYISAPKLSGTPYKLAVAVLGTSAGFLWWGINTLKGTIHPETFPAANYIGMLTISLLHYMVWGAVITGIISVGMRLAKTSPQARTAMIRKAALISVIIAVAATAYGIGEARRLSTPEYEIVSSKLPASFDGYRIGVITDLHLGPVNDAELTAKAVQIVNDKNVDMVVLGGDLVDGLVSQIGDYVQPLEDITAPDGVFAVSGNHEFYADSPDNWMRQWAKHGADVIDNSHRVITRGSDSIVLGGLSDATATEGYEPSVKDMFPTQPEDFTIVLAHQPVQVTDSASVAADLQISGHTHGGQLWPFRYLVMLAQPAIDGVKTVQGVPIVTSRGAGTWATPVRVGASPQIPIVTLRHEK